MTKFWPALLFVALLASYGAAQETGKLNEFKDDQYLFRFLYPADWKLEPLPEGEKNPTMRVRLRGPSGDDRRGRCRPARDG